MVEPANHEPADRLSECIQAFVPSVANIAAGFILSLLLLVGGAAAIASSLRAVYRAGGKLPLYGNSIGDIYGFGDVLREQAKRLALSWETVEQQA